MKLVKDCVNARAVQDFFYQTRNGFATNLYYITTDLMQVVNFVIKLEHQASWFQASCIKPLGVRVTVTLDFDVT